MRSKKLMALMVAPIFAVGMAACETEPAQDDVWTDEGQLPAYETQPTPYDDPAMQDTLMVPEQRQHDLDTEPGMEPGTTPGTDPQTGTEPQY